MTFGGCPSASWRKCSQTENRNRAREFSPWVICKGQAVTACMICVDESGRGGGASRSASIPRRCGGCDEGFHECVNPGNGQQPRPLAGVVLPLEGQRGTRRAPDSPRGPSVHDARLLSRKKFRFGSPYSAVLIFGKIGGGGG